ncbi:CAP domain-containing protein [Metabacillus indicus]|uniref:CAP domain-containing protein n=1 Tax=Metabacillus indicus TaxID=246786 RepID=UPI0024902966|nr:CAP domain-containing protein [Metabacillus indicus]
MGGIFKTFFLLLIIAGSYFLYIQYGNHEQPIRQQDESEQLAGQSEEQLNVSEEGVLSFIGKSSDDIVNTLGEPVRIDPSSYDYEWWIYNQNDRQYLQVGVKDNKVVTVYAIGPDVNVNPYKLGQPAGDVFKTNSISSSISIDLNGSSYRFEMSEEDMNTRPIVQIGDIFVQLYLDKFDGELSSIRALDKETLIKQRPYEVVYRGELLEPAELTDEQWKAVEEGAEKQILDLTNVIRDRHGVPPVEWDQMTSEVAFGHSNDMLVNNYFSHESPTEGTLGDRLKEGGVTYQLAGENIAAQYIDGIAAVEGWLNSKGHREALLNPEFTKLGVGVNELYYTQNFIRPFE